MPDQLFYLLPLLVLISFSYSSVGHGGASGYIAILTLVGIQGFLIKPSALILNLIVSSISFFQFYRAGHFKWYLFWPFAITSIPMAYVGSIIKVDPHLFQKFLGFALFFPILKLIGIFNNKNEVSNNVNLIGALLIGGILGFLSGMLGIGGGIFLTPIIILLGWANMKTAAAVSALFIFVNSLSGLFGLISKGLVIENNVYLWIAAAVCGGGVGAYFGSTKFNSKTLQYILALILLVAAFKLILT